MKNLYSELGVHELSGWLKVKGHIEKSNIENLLPGQGIWTHIIFE